LRLAYQCQNVRESDEYANLTADQKEEFNLIIQDFYTYSVSLDIDPTSF
jgi:hypothetical protein